ncbi:MAG: prolyl oligopeptidase family serine peptidase [Bacteroidota bacterium]
MKKYLFFLLMQLATVLSFAQQVDLTEVITFEASNVSLSETFAALKTQTGIAFAFNNSSFTDQQYSWNFKNKSLSEILQEITDQVGLVFDMKNSYILVTRNSKAESNTPITKAIRGKVVDQKNRYPLPFAAIRIKGSGSGVVSNEVGEFRLSLKDIHTTDTLQISFIGFYNQEVPISAFGVKPLEIVMIENIVTLAEVEIKPIDPLDVMREALSKIKLNYNTEPFGYDAYYREIVKVDSSFVKYADAATYIYNYGYTQRDSNQVLHPLTNTYGILPFPEASAHLFGQVANKQVRIVEARASDNLQTIRGGMGIYDFEQFNISNGIQKALGCDYVKTPIQFLDQNKWRFYEFELEDYVNYNDERVYVISFKPKRKNIKKALVSGKVYIDIESSAIVSYEIEIPETLQPKFKKVSWIKFVGTIPKKFRADHGGKATIRRTMSDYNHRIKVEFQKYNGKWYLFAVRNSAQYQNYGSILEDIWFETTRELIVNRILTNDVNTIAKRNRFSGHLFNYPTSYAPEFWNTYNSVLPSGIFKKALKDLERDKSLEEQFKGRVTKDTTLLPPVPRKISTEKTIHSVTLTDNYQWLQDPYDDEVQEHIRLENAYTHNYMIPLEKLRRDLFYEMVERVKKNDASVPVKIDDYYYYGRFVDTLSYPIYCRKHRSLNAKEEIVHDVNKLAKGYDYYSFTPSNPNPDHTIYPYYENLDGGFESKLKLKNLKEGTLLPDSLLHVNDLVWFEHGGAFLYTKQDAESKRSYQVYLHHLGTSQLSDELVYEEKDPTFSVNLGKSKSDKYLFIYASSKDENEVYLIDASTSNIRKTLFYERQKGHMYHMTHVGKSFYIASNLDAPNYQLFKTPDDKLDRENWDLIIPYQQDALLTNFQVFDQYLVIANKRNAQDYLKILDLKTGKIRNLSFKKHPHVVSLMSNPNAKSRSFKFEYEDPLTPPITYEYNFESGLKTIIKEPKIQGAYDKKEYKIDRIFVTAHDGAEIPVTLIYKKGALRPTVRKVNGNKTLGKRKLYLTSYGAYGISSDPYFSYARLSLLDRRVIYAIAHVRGGTDKGETWYQDGKLLNKKNTFKDFISVAEHLIEKDYVEKGRIVASGGSAGGLLVGTVVNERPELFQAAILNMPFLDVVNTMLDESLPLTTGEYKEWGDPSKKEYFDYMLSYAPYENVKRQDYPNIFLTCAINDDNVPYWETVKMAAKLREFKTNHNEILLRVNTTGGHTGGSKRFDGFQELSVEYAYILDLWNNL